MMVVLIVYSIAVDLYIFFDIRQYARHKVWQWVYAALSVLCWAFMIVMFCLPRRNSSESTSVVMWMCYSYLSVYVPKLVYVVCSLFGRLFGALFKQSRLLARVTMRWIGIPLALLVFVAMWWGVVGGRRQMQTQYVDISSRRLPEAFNGYKIAQLSDLHVGTWGNDTTFVSELVDSVNALKPDLIVFTGDLVNCSSKELLPFVSVLSRLSAPDGVYSILGNHDYGDYLDWPSPKAKADNLQLLKDLQAKMGWKMLNNEHDFIVANGDSLTIIGVENWGDPPFQQYGDEAVAYGNNPDSAYNINDQRFKVLLTHNPEHWNQKISRNSNIDLSLAGHTHAMQMMLTLGDWRWSPAKWRYEQWGGLYERINQRGEPVKLYVNIGDGEVGMPFRIGADPEITLFTLRNAL